ncbi:hypothetical protein FHH43_07645 [Clostridium perfringens]|nr:hypothetical protein [Clostridium perfringens]
MVVNRSIKNEESCNINIPRTTTYKQFKEIYDFYNLHISRENGIREKNEKFKLRYLSEYFSYETL